VLRYERAAIAGGEVWRLVSCHFVHLGWAHCLLNVGGVAALATILPSPLRAWRCSQFGLAGGVAIRFRPTILGEPARPSKSPDQNL